MREHQGTLGRVYGGDPQFIHVRDGYRAELGEDAADYVDFQMRKYAEDRTDFEKATLPLCPGCYMVVGFNMLVELAKRSGQSKTELARSMIGAFERLLYEGDYLKIEEIEVLLDPPNKEKPCV